MSADNPWTVKIRVDPLGRETAFCYNAFNVLESTTDADGIVTKYTYSKAGLVSKVERVLSGETLSSVSVAYDGCGRPVSCTDQDGLTKSVERDALGRVVRETFPDSSETAYSYDAAGRRTRRATKDSNGDVVSEETRAYDRYGRLAETRSGGRAVKYAYDAKGRMVREGARTYRYGYLDKVLAVAEGDRLYSYDYHVDGQLARAERGRVEDTGFVTRESEEDFLWDGLALVKRGGRRYVNEPHAGGGNPVLADDGTAYFNDMLGTSLAAVGGGKAEPFGLTAFGDELPGGTEQGGAPPSPFFTGKPHVDGLGRVFLMRNYRASLGKWQTADPLGYPDGWNQLAYCGNAAASAVDLWGALTVNYNTQEVNVKDEAIGDWFDGEDGYEYRWRMKTWNMMYDVGEIERTELQKWLGLCGVSTAGIGAILAITAITISAPWLTTAALVAAFTGLGVDIAANETMNGTPKMKVILEKFVDPKLNLDTYKERRLKPE